MPPEAERGAPPHTDGLAGWGWALAQEKLVGVDPARWQHVQGAVARAREVQRCLEADGDLLLAAVALHDIGKAPDLLLTGFWPLDGAAYLRTIGARPRLVNLVANFAGSRIEGSLRGFAAEYEVLPDEASEVRDAVWFCCLTSGRTGERVTLDERMAEWELRYGDDPVISEFCRVAADDLRAAVRRTEKRLDRAD